VGYLFYNNASVGNCSSRDFGDHPPIIDLTTSLLTRRGYVKDFRSYDQCLGQDCRSQYIGAVVNAAKELVTIYAEQEKGGIRLQATLSSTGRVTTFQDQAILLP